MENPISLRGRLIRMAHQVQGDPLPVHFRESPAPNMAVLVPAFIHWAKMWRARSALALFDYRLRRLQEWLKATSMTSATL